MPVHISLSIMVGYFMYVFEISTQRAPEDRKNIHVPLSHLESESFLVSDFSCVSLGFKMKILESM